jgi:protein PhnA
MDTSRRSSVGDHDIDANVPGFGRLQLKSSVVKKSS